MRSRAVRSNEISSMSAAWDVLGPPRGPCAFCGSDDARHRVVDSIVEMVDAGDSPALIAEDFGLTEEAVVALVQFEHRRPRQLEDAARAYVAARIRNEGAEPVDWGYRAAEVDRTWHDLLEAFEQHDPTTASEASALSGEAPAVSQESR